MTGMPSPGGVAAAGALVDMAAQSREIVVGADSGSDRRRLLRAGGHSALALAALYVAITGVYVLEGTRPEGAEGWLVHLADHAPQWWVILGLSVVTDLLFFPLLTALFAALKHVDRLVLGAGVGLVGLFALLDLAITWPGYASLIRLSGVFAGGTDAEQAAALAAATFALSILESSFLAVYLILVPALGILGVSLVMRKGSFGRAVAPVGIATGVLGALAVLGPVVSDTLGLLAVPTSILTAVWVLLAGLGLYRSAAE